jgi:hypothetical protein
MRALILIACSALAVAACGKNDAAGNTANLDQGLTADSIVSNDVTAIDAVTGADANMAADVNYLPEVPNGPAGSAPSGTARPSRPETGASPAANAATTEPAPAANTTANAATNTAL